MTDKNMEGTSDIGDYANSILDSSLPIKHSPEKLKSPVMSIFETMQFKIK